MSLGTAVAFGLVFLIIGGVWLLHWPRQGPWMAGEGMTRDRYTDVELGATLTPDEVAAGWHRCPDWDYGLIGPGMIEADACLCGRGRRP